METSADSPGDRTGNVVLTSCYTTRPCPVGKRTSSSWRNFVVVTIIMCAYAVLRTLFFAGHWSGFNTPTFSSANGNYIDHRCIKLNLHVGYCVILYASVNSPASLISIGLTGHHEFGTAY